MPNLSYDVAVGSMRALADVGRLGFLDGQGVSQHDFEMLTGDVQWQATDRNRMATVFHQIVNASVDRLGIPRFSLPAEYLAAGIAMFVSGVNCMAACQFVCDAKPVSAQDQGAMQKVEGCKPEQIFALLIQLYDSVAKNDAQSRFVRNTNLSIGRMSPDVGSKKK